MTCHAAVAITVRGGLSLDGFDELVEQLRETAYPQPGGRTILVSWDAPDAWTLRGMVEETVSQVEANFYGYVEFPDRDNPGDGSDTNLARFQWWVNIQPPVRLPYRDIGYTDVECERDFAKLGLHCPNPDEHNREATRDVHMQGKP